jgi:subtilisin family serine protease
MAKQTILEDVEQIIDEGDGPTRSVIVRLRTENEWREPALRAASYRMLQRSLSLSSREVLPKALAEQEVAAQTRAEEKRLGAPAKLPKTTLAQIRTQSTKSLRILLKAEPVSRHAGDAARGELAQFVASRSALVELSKDELVELVEKTPEIAGVYPNRHLGVPRVIEAKRLPANVEDNKTSAWGVAAIGALAVWGAYGARGEKIKVGVLDTGVDDTHPDLQGKITGWAEFDAQGQQVQGSTPHDTDRHGTHVSGTIVGGNASGQWIGVAPEARLAVGLVLNGDIGGTDAQVLAGIDWALLQEKVHVISMSLGGLTIGPDVPSIYTEAILSCVQAGVPVVTAIGNEGNQTSGSPGNDLLAFAVGASGVDDRIAGFSGGRTQIIRESNIIPPDFLPLPYSKPEISAPGVAVRSSVPGSDWAYFNGTSMATPHVAGAIALLLSATFIRSKIDAADRAFFIQDLLTGSVEELGEVGQDHRFGFGRLDILRAIGFAREEGL